MHTIGIQVTDNVDDGVPFNTTFIKLDDTIDFKINVIETAKKTKKIAFGLLDHKQLGDYIKVYAANNAFDATPTWEDITDAYLSGNEHNFVNNTKTAAKWGLCVRVVLKKSFAKP